MRKRYIGAGNVMIDTVYHPGEPPRENQLGGPGIFAFSGIKLFTDDCRLVCRVGSDFWDIFDAWLTENRIGREGINVSGEHSNHIVLTYRPDGTYAHNSVYGYQNLIDLKTLPADIEPFADGLAAMYIAQDLSREVWNDYFALKKRYGFAMMWEIEATFCTPELRGRVAEIASELEMFSLNIEEARSMFDTSDEESIIDELRRLGCPYTLLRLGGRGVCSIGRSGYYYLESAPLPADKRMVDVTGCGNTSTGACAYAYGEYGDDPLMIGIVANVAASFNLRQYGVIPSFGGATRDEAKALVDRLYREYRG